MKCWQLRTDSRLARARESLPECQLTTASRRRPQLRTPLALSASICAHASVSDFDFFHAPRSLLHDSVCDRITAHHRPNKTYHPTSSASLGSSGYQALASVTVFFVLPAIASTSSRCTPSFCACCFCTRTGRRHASSSLWTTSKRQTLQFKLITPLRIRCNAAGQADVHAGASHIYVALRWTRISKIYRARERSEWHVAARRCTGTDAFGLDD